MTGNWRSVPRHRSGFAHQVSASITGVQVSGWGEGYRGSVNMRRRTCSDTGTQVPSVPNSSFKVLARYLGIVGALQKTHHLINDDNEIAKFHLRAQINHVLQNCRSAER